MTPYKCLNFWIGTFLVFLLLSHATGCTELQLPGGEKKLINQVENALFVKGRVQSIVHENNEIIIKPNKGDKVLVFYNESTAYSGFQQYDDIKEKRTIKVWYLPHDDKNKAVKIELLPEMGC
jgi:hypothetical protein